MAVSLILRYHNKYEENKYNFFWFTVSFLILFNVYGFAFISSECPKPDIIDPCICVYKTDIHCYGNQTLNLKEIFNNLSQKLENGNKHFDRFYLNNTAIHELEEFVFSDITFNEIFIRNATNLSLINTNAFNETDFITRSIDIENSPIINNPPKYDIFKSLSKFKNLNDLYVINTNITEIPSNAFTPINGFQDNLTELRISGHNLVNISSNAFYNLNSLSDLDIHYSSIKTIPSNAFHFHSESNNTIDIKIDSNLLNGSHIETDALITIGRPVILDIICERYNCKIDYLDQKIIEPFLRMNPKNNITCYNKFQIDCTDCRNFWMVKNHNYINKQQITDINCNNGYYILNDKNFKNCTT